MLVAPRLEDPERPSDEGFQMSGPCLTFCPSGVRRVMAELFPKGLGQTLNLSPTVYTRGRSVCVTTCVTTRVGTQGPL